MSIEETHAVFEAFRASCNERWLEVEAMVSLFSEEGVAAYGGREQLRAAEASFREGFPDMTREFTHIVVGENGFASVSTMRGKNSGPIFGHAPTGREIEIETASFCSVKDSRICGSFVPGLSQWTATFWEQLGLPQPAS